MKTKAKPPKTPTKGGSDAKRPTGGNSRFTPDANGK